MTQEYTKYLWETLTDELLRQQVDVLDLLLERLFGINMYSDTNREDEEYASE